MKNIYLFLIGMSLIGRGLCAADEQKYFVNYSIGSPVINLLFPSGRSDSIFREFHTAINIDEIRCDEKSISPDVVAINGYPDKVALDVKGAELIYRCSSLMLYCFDDIEKRSNSGYMIRKFNIPENVKKIEITYRVRYPNGGASSPIRVVFIGSEEKITLIDLK